MSVRSMGGAGVVGGRGRRRARTRWVRGRVGSHRVPRRRDEGAIREAGDRLGGAAAEALVEVVAEQGEQLEAESTGDPGRARVFGEIGARVEEVRVAGDEAEGLVVGVLGEGLHGVGEELAGEGGPWEATAASSGQSSTNADRRRIARSMRAMDRSAVLRGSSCAVLEAMRVLPVPVRRASALPLPATHRLFYFLPRIGSSTSCHDASIGDAA